MRAELEVTTELARALLREQHPDLAAMPLRVAAHGWDNVMVRAGDDLVLRLPRRDAAAHLIENERAALPLLAPALRAAVPDVAIPLAVRAGVPSPALGYPWAWSVLRWVDGVRAADTPAGRRTAWAPQLGRFLAALHRPVQDGVAPPSNPLRGVPLAQRPEPRLGALRGLPAAVADTLRRIWDRALAAPSYTGEPVWLHGDPHPANLVVRPRPGPDGSDALVAVIDFGDVTAGDPASDLGALWLTFDATGRAACRSAMAAGGRRWDEATWARARGWALVYTTAMLAHPDEHPALVPIGRHGLDALLQEA